MGPSPVSTPHPAPHQTSPHPPAQAKGGSTTSAGGGNNANGTTQPTQSSHPAPGTGLLVDKHV